MLPAFWLGLKYDLRWIAILLLPISVLSLSPKLSPFYNARMKKFWTIYLGILTFFVLLVYGADFGQFAYANARLNAEALMFIEDPTVSFRLFWRSYPVVWITIGMIGAILMMLWVFRRTHVGVVGNNISIHKFDYRRRWHLLSLILLGWFIYGFFTAEPLKLFRAFNLNNEFKYNLALNPLQNFFSSLRFRDPESKSSAKEYYQDMQAFLNLENTVTTEGYSRIIQPRNNNVAEEPNIVLVILKSYSMYKSTMSGNPLNATPYFNQLSQRGIFFDRCFSTGFGSARSVFALLTGIPDVQIREFAIRNDSAVRQSCIINEFTDYQKYYFIGGNSRQNNYFTLLQNIGGIQIYEEGKFSDRQGNTSVLNDKELYREANALFAKQEKPFFGIIQTSDNRRPFNQYEKDAGFQPRNLHPDSLQKYGFESLNEFNAFAYSDFCLQNFMESAKKEDYFQNTIFVFVGDHGIDGNATEMYPGAWVEQRLAEEHIPLLFYAPALLCPQKHSETVSQIDVLPTIAGLKNRPYMNHSLGRDLLDSTYQKQNAAFIMYHATGWIGVANDHYFYRRNLRMQKEELVPLQFNVPKLTEAETDSVKNKLSRLSHALYESARMMLMHEK